MGVWREGVRVWREGVREGGRVHKALYGVDNGLSPHDAVRRAGLAVSQWQWL